MTQHSLPRPTTSGAASRAAALLLSVLAALALVLAAPVPPGNASTSDAAPGQHTSLVTRFGPPDASFAESLAVGSHGNMYVSKTVWGETNSGSVVLVRPSGAKKRFGPRFELGSTGMLMGVAVNRRDHVFVAHYDFSGKARSTIVRVTPGGARTVATLPAGSWPNGLTFHRGVLYVSDSARGDVWSFRPSARVQRLSRPWLHSPRLQPAAGQDIGVNGLAFWGDHLFLVNYTRDTLLRAGVGRRGHPLAPKVVTRDARLHTADGIAFDRAGRLWVTVNGTGEVGKPLHGQHLLRMSRTGTVQVAVADAPWMNYPTAVAVGRTPLSAHRVFVTDGAFNGGSPDLRSFDVR